METLKITTIQHSKLKSVDFNNLGFGKTFSDHMLICDYKNGNWGAPEIVPFQPISLMPSSKIFHYGQSIFEGMKAYKDKDLNTWLFRPNENFKRLNKSAKRLAIPEVPEAVFFNGLKALLKLDNVWIPTKEGSSLYIRPIIFATGQGFHASPADAYRFLIATAPSGPYFSGQVKVLMKKSTPVLQMEALDLQKLVEIMQRSFIQHSWLLTKVIIKLFGPMIIPMNILKKLER
jgi:branched-chain amino acid aminotransferase